MFVLISSITILLFIILLLYLKLIKKYDFNKLDKLIKVLSIIYCIVVFLNLFLPDGFAREYTEDALLNKNGFYENTVRWLANTAFIIIPVVSFFNNRILNKVASFIVLPFTLLYLFSYKVIIKSFIDPAGNGVNTIRFASEGFKEFMLNETFRTIIFSFLSVLPIIILLIILFKNLDLLKFDKKEIVPFILTSFAIILLALPCYTPQYYFGHSSIIFKRFSLVHFAVIIFMISETILIYKIFKNSSNETKLIVLLLMSLSLLFQFNQVFTGTSEIRMQKFPFQLCNIGSYLMLITLITKNNHLFRFSLVVNVVGATIAMIVLDVSDTGIAYYWNVHYILEHGKVIIIPILCLLFKIFEPLKKKDVKDVIIGFTSYFIFVLIFGTITNGFYTKLDNDYFKVNYLFMFIQEDTANIVGFVGPWFNTKINLGMFTLYPLVQIPVYIVFTGLCIGCFYLLYILSNNKSKQITN